MRSPGPSRSRLSLGRTEPVVGRPRCGRLASGGGNGSRKLNAYGVDPLRRNDCRRSSASWMVGMCPAGTHHSTVIASSSFTNHLRRCRMISTCAVLKTKSASCSRDSQTDMLTKMESSPKARNDVASPASSWRRHTKPGAASATALIGSSASRNPVIGSDSSGAINVPMFN